MKKIVPNGTQVLIFKYVREWGSNQDNEHFISGIITSSKESEDLSYHGSPYFEQIYKVLGEDGKEYYGTYGNGLVGNAFFRTIADHTAYLESVISRNNQQIENLENKNCAYIQTINDLEKLQLETIMKNISNEKIDSLIENYSRFGSLDAAYAYLKTHNCVCLVLAYCNWNDEVKMLSEHGIYYHNFDEENNINLKISAMPTESVVNSFSQSNGQVIYDKYGILANQKRKTLSKIANSDKKLI